MANLNNNFNNYPFQNQPIQPMQQYFIQPQGMVYFINTPNEINNITMSSNIIAAICVPEETCYIKIVQNGIPSISAYKLVSQNNENKNESNVLADLDRRLTALENTIKKGGRLDELL